MTPYISRSEILKKLLSTGASIWDVLLLPLGVNLTTEASSPPSFCFHLCSHERQDQRLDSGNELFLNIKQTKQESQGIGGGVGLKSPPPPNEEILEPGFTVDTEPASLMEIKQFSRNCDLNAAVSLKLCSGVSSSAWH